jgi:hypothetical protein
MARELITINDQNYQQFIDPIVNGEQYHCTSNGIFLPGMAAGEVVEFEEQDEIQLVPEDEIDDRFRQFEKDGETMDVIMRDSGLHTLDQDGTSSCWGQSVTFTGMMFRLMTTLRVYLLSPASVCGPVTGWRDVGGFGINAAKQAQRVGWLEQNVMKPNAVVSGRSVWTPENQELAKRHQVLRWMRVTTRQQEASCICARRAVSGGYNWWRHQVATVHMYAGQWKTKKKIVNTWGDDWSEDGYGNLEGSRSQADDMLCLLDMSPL